MLPEAQEDRAAAICSVHAGRSVSPVVHNVTGSSQNIIHISSSTRQIWAKV